MYNEFKEEKVECCILVADANNSNYYYKVALPQIEEAKKTIQLTFAKFNTSCQRIYISGFVLEKEDNIMTREEIIKKAIREATSINSYQEKTI